MGAEDLLRGARALSALVTAVALALPSPALANGRDGTVNQEEERRQTPALLKPRRLTVGDQNHFMGVLGPGGRYLYYVTDEYKSYDIFIQSPIDSAGQPLFEAFGDVVWPTISPDGRELAYIRYETEAQGDACRRRIRNDGSARNKREDCHATDEADLQIHWRNDGRLGVLLREELHGNLVLLDGAFEKDPQRKEANVVGLALSHDERWVAYVPLVRRHDEIGVSFSNQIGTEGIRIRRTREGAREFGYEPKLPGVSGYPVFSPDDAYLYFSQFLNDTNEDGVIDGDDNGVLFRVPFRGDAEKPEFGQPRQLTNARWNCHYPSVRDTSMALTCAIGRNLHIYLLPASGAVPADWNQERIAAETESVRDAWSELLLRQHLLVGARDDLERSEQLRALTKLHLDLREYEAAIYYGEQRKELLRTSGVTDRWSELMILLAKHQRADKALSRGRLSEEYVQESITLAEQVNSVDTDQSPDSAALQSLVLSKIESDSGDKAAAERLLDRVNLAPVQDETVIDLAFQQFDHFYGLLADYEKRLARLKEVALHPAPSVTESLRHCKSFVDLLQRGQPRDARVARLIDARRTVPDQSHLALALDLEIALDQLTEDNAKAVEEQLVGLFSATKNAHVRRYLVVSALRAAHRRGVPSLEQALLERWVASIEQDDPERKTSTALYELVVLERAYAAFDKGDMETAARYFDKARGATDSLAGHVGWIETELRLGSKNPQALDQRKGGKKHARHAVSESEATRQFVEAYLLARDLGSIESNKDLERTVERAQTLLEAAIEEDPNQPLEHLLLAHALHHRGMRLGRRDDMALAVRHYLLALDLAQKQPRVRAPTHAGMALAQASLGNHRRALEDYEARLDLPTISAEEEIGLLVEYARSLFHVNQQPKAIEALRGALALMHQDGEVAEVSGATGHPTEGLERYEPLILDRLALYELDARQTEHSMETHAQLQRSLQSHPEADSAVNEVKTWARLAAAHLAGGDPKSALGFATKGQERLSSADPLRPKDIDRRIRPVTHEFVYDEEQLRILLAGLEASAARQTGDWEQARASLLIRKEALEERYERQEVDEDALELALTCLRLAEVAQKRRDLQQTKRYLEEGLAYTDRHAGSTGSDVSEVGFHLLRAYAELHFSGGVDLASYQRDLEQDLLRYYVFLSEVRNPQWETERIRFEIYLSLLRMEKAPAPEP
ncbi:MAG TPA: hypothetical protein VFG22_19420 [Polyangiales bacterium]|nr:hypothetical protein [Polyangiales bacterium]